MSSASTGIAAVWLFVRADITLLAVRREARADGPVERETMEDADDPGCRMVRR